MIKAIVRTTDGRVTKFDATSLEEAIERFSRDFHHSYIWVHFINLDRKEDEVE